MVSGLTDLAAASSGTGSDRLPIVIALLVVLATGLGAAVAVLVRRARRPARLQDSPPPALPGDAVSGSSTAPAGMTDSADRLDSADHLGSSGGLARPGASRHGMEPTMLVAAAAALALVIGLVVAVAVAGSSHRAAGRHVTAAAAGNAGTGQPGEPFAPGGAGTPSPRKARGHGSGPAGRGSGPANGGPAKGGAARRGAANSGSGGSGGSSSPSSPGTSTSGGQGSSGGAGSIPAAASTPPPPQGTLTGYPTQLACPSKETYQCSFVITATGGTVSYTVSEPASEVPLWNIEIENPAGTLTAGQQKTIGLNMEAIDYYNQPAPVDVTLNPGAITVAVEPVSS